MSFQALQITINLNSVMRYILLFFAEVTLKSMQSTDHRKVNLELVSFSSCHRFWLIFFFNLTSIEILDYKHWQN